jgi:hypothetical protein
MKRSIFIEGWGENAVGGADAKEYVVTSLENTLEEGTLPHALKQPGPRYITFAVSGTFDSPVPLIVPDFTTIDGLGAPGKGVCLKCGLVLNSFIVISNLRIRPNGCKGDGIEVVGHDIGIDHCSLSWCTDELIGVKRNQPLETTEPPIPRNLTIQWCILSWSEKGFLGWYAHRTTFHHNLCAHLDYRAPVCAGSGNLDYPGYYDVRNNVVYDICSEAGSAQGSICVNYVGNTYLVGSDRPHIYSITEKNGPGAAWTQIYLEDHIGPHVSAGKHDWEEIRNSTGGPAGFEEVNRRAEEFTMPHVFTQSADEAYELVLGGAGASPRDTIDASVVDDVRLGLNRGKYPRGWKESQELARIAWETLSYEPDASDEEEENDMDVTYDDVVATVVAGQVIKAVAVAQDSDGDTVEITWVWEKYSEALGDFEVLPYTGDTVTAIEGTMRVTAKPFDGNEYGEAKTAIIAVSRANTPPVISSLTVEVV